MDRLIGEGLLRSTEDRRHFTRIYPSSGQSLIRKRLKARRGKRTRIGETAQ